MKRSFKVEIRDTCKVCGGELPNARFRSYCGDKCRKSFYNKGNTEKMKQWRDTRRAKNE